MAKDEPIADPGSLDGVLAGVLHGSWLGVLLLTPEARVRWANAASARLLGLPPESLPGRVLRHFFADDDTQHPALARLESCLASGEPLRPGFELQLRGQPRWLRLELQQLPAEQRAAQGLGGALALVDVTEQRRSREEAGREGQLLREAARLGHIGAWDYDFLAQRLRWSDETFAIHDLPVGTPPDGEAALGFFDELSEPQVRAAMEHAWAEGTPFDLSLGLVSATGRAKRVRLIGSAQRDGGRVVRVAGLFHDITEREEHAQALRDKAAAERASRAKSEFLSRVSHELRTPLNGVLGFSQLLQQRAIELPAWTAEPLRLIQQAGDHLLTLIDDMLDLGSIESGAPQLTLAPVALDPVVAEALRLVAPQAQAAGVALQQWQPSGAWAHADATRLRQVLLNLLSNAIKYNRPGGDVRVLLRAERDGLVLRVVDSGPGIGAAQRRELFQPFNRAGAETGVVPGTGLGLTIARHLAEAMGGRLELAPQPGGAATGTEMQVSLQRAQPPAAHAGPAAAPADSRRDAGADAEARRACCVLYIEDHPVNAMLVSEALAMQQPRHRLCLAETGEQGLEMVAGERPDIVLLDLNLPGADGYAVLASLRAEPATAGLPCVAVSADAMPEEVARARAAGFDDYWTKPLAMLGLAERIAQVVAGSSRARA